MQIKPLPEAFEGEIIDLELDALQDSDTKNELRRALHDYLVVVVRDQQLVV